jgi:hypothetical protein
MTPARPEHTSVGAYGLRLTGIAQARRFLVPAKPGWPALRLQRRRRLAPDRSHDTVSETRADLRLQTGGEITIDRARAIAVFTTPKPLHSAALVHPFLAPVAAVMAHWLGRESFHAGAFVHADGAWAVIGEREAGKSTLLARLALGGIPILSDDMLVLENSIPLAGPRAIDLRPSAAKELGVGDPMGIVGARERWRLRLGPVPEAALRGWIFLTWGQRLQLREVGPRARIERLSAQRGLPVPARNPAALLDLAALPSWELTRPRSWRALARSVDILLERLGS